MGKNDDGGANGAPGTGAGITTIPFVDTGNFTNYPCAGGGGAASYDTYSSSGGGWVYYAGNGGTGGSNGNSGGAGSKGVQVNSLSYGYGGSGGATGGGAGGKATGGGHTAGTYYGAGGGGRTTGSGAAGYQGVMYIRIPKDPKAVDTGYKYYRLNMQRMKRASAFSPYFSVAEFALYSGDAAISYSGASFTASSSLSGYEVAKAFDGSSTTLWHVDGNPSSAWLQVELSQAAKATSFALTMRSDQNDRLDAFLLEGSNDGTNYTQLCIATDAANGWAQGGTKTFLV